MPLHDPCPECGFNGNRLTIADLEATVRSLPRRWAEVEAAAARKDVDVSDEAGHAVDGLLSAIATVRGGAAARSGRQTPGAAAEALAAELDRIDDPWSRSGVFESVKEAAHAGIHFLKEAQRRGS
jgi:hypothetical protein